MTYKYIFTITYLGILFWLFHRLPSQEESLTTTSLLNIAMLIAYLYYTKKIGILRELYALWGVKEKVEDERLGNFLDKATKPD